MPAEPTPAPGDSTPSSHDPYLALVAAVEDLTRTHRETGALVARAAGSSRAGLAVVRTLELAGPMQIGDIAHALRVDISVASRQVSALVAAGLAARTVDDDDRRARAVVLTEEGRAVADRARVAAGALTAQVLADWSGPDVATTAAQIRRLADTVTAYVVALRDAGDESVGAAEADPA